MPFMIIGKRHGFCLAGDDISRLTPIGHMTLRRGPDSKASNPERFLEVRVLFASGNPESAAHSATMNFVLVGVFI